MCNFSQNIILPNLMEKLEYVQYSTALAFTGAWRGTSREKLYTELGWESLSFRRWSRVLNRLTVYLYSWSKGYISVGSMKIYNFCVLFTIFTRFLSLCCVYSASDDETCQLNSVITV